MTTPPTSTTPPPRRLRFRKRYAAAAVALVFSVVLTKRGSLCVPVTEDGTQVCVSVQMLHVSHAAVLPDCTDELRDANALDASGGEVVCAPGIGWVRPDGGAL